MCISTTGSTSSSSRSRDAKVMLTPHSGIPRGSGTASKAMAASIGYEN